MTSGTLVVTEIFHSIQGESSFMGLPCVFVRLTGCPLRCRWCDTDYAFQGGTRMSTDEVLEKVAAYGGRVNTPGRFEYFQDIGADSIDGTGLSRYSWMRKAIYDRESQLRLFEKTAVGA